LKHSLSAYARDLEADGAVEAESDFDALNDETFGAATTEDWESAHEQMANIDNGGAFFEAIATISKSSAIKSNASNDGRTFMAHQLEGHLIHDRSKEGLVPPNAPTSIIPPGLAETFFNLNLGATSTPTVGRTNPSGLPHQLSSSSLIGNVSQSPSSQTSHLNDSNWVMSQVEQSYFQNLKNLQTANSSTQSKAPTSNHTSSTKSTRLEDIESSVLSMFQEPNNYYGLKFAQQLPQQQLPPHLSQHQSPSIASQMGNQVPPTMPPHFPYESPMLPKHQPPQSNATRKVFTLDELENFSGGDTPNRSMDRLPPGLHSPASGRHTPNSSFHQRGDSDARYSYQQRNAAQSNDNRSNVRYCPNPLNPLEMIPIDELKQERYDIQAHHSNSSYQRNEYRNDNGYYNNNHNNSNNQRPNYRGANMMQRGGGGVGYGNRGRHYPHGINYGPQSYNRDEYAGLMTRRDVDRVRKILRMPLEFDDPYVQDYYYVTYQTRKIAAQMMRKERESGQNRSIPTLIVPDRASALSTKDGGKSSAYIPLDFAGSLGKLQVSNVNCPRKLLDFGNKLQRLEQQQESCHDPLSVTETRSEVNKFRQMLIEIERNYSYILEIDLEDKRMAALPEEARAPHIARRAELCELIFKDILTTEDQKHLNLSIANVRKGCMLMFRAIQAFQDPAMKAMCIAELLNVNNFHYVVMQKDKTLYCLDYGQILVESIKTIKDCDFGLLLKIANGLDDPSVIAKFQVIFVFMTFCHFQSNQSNRSILGVLQCGQEIIEVLLNQYFEFKESTPTNQKQWYVILIQILV
jgi:hypothetical protein